MAITLFGTASTPADNGTNTANPTVITPPASMQAGDLVFVTVCQSSSSGTVAVSQAGGQSWTSLTQRNATRNRARSFWCVFNGTWSASPSFTTASSANGIARMLVFRPNGGTSSTWAVDTAEASATYAAPTTPFTVTIPTLTTTANGALVIVGWTSADDNTWGSLGGSTHTWTALSPAQVRNTSGTYQQSQTHAWMIDATAGATGTAYQNQATLGGDAGTIVSIAFKEVEQHSGAAVITGNGAQVGVGNKQGNGVATISALGSIVAVGVAAMFGLATISGNGNLQSVGQKKASGVSVVSGAGSLTAVGEKQEAEQHSGVATVSGGGAQVASGKKTSSGQSSVSGNGSVVGTGGKHANGLSSVSGGGVATGVGRKGAPGIASVSGGGGLAAAGEQTQVETHSGSASVSGSGSVVSVGTKGGAGTATVIIDGGGTTGDGELKRWTGTEWVKVDTLVVFQDI